MVGSDLTYEPNCIRLDPIIALCNGVIMVDGLGFLLESEKLIQ